MGSIYRGPSYYSPRNICLSGIFCADIVGAYPCVAVPGPLLRRCGWALFAHARESLPLLAAVFPFKGVDQTLIRVLRNRYPSFIRIWNETKKSNGKQALVTWRILEKDLFIVETILNEMDNSIQLALVVEPVLGYLESQLKTSTKEMSPQMYDFLSERLKRHQRVTRGEPLITCNMTPISLLVKQLLQGRKSGQVVRLIVGKTSQEKSRSKKPSGREGKEGRQLLEYSIGIGIVGWMSLINAPVAAVISGVFGATALFATRRDRTIGERLRRLLPVYREQFFLAAA
jgi:hypothetical protein